MSNSSMPAKALMPTINGRPDYALSEALKKVSPQAQSKTKEKAQDFEAMFLNSMFQHMMTGVDGEGPFGGSTGIGVWRSFVTNEYAKSIAKKGGIGIADQVMSSLIAQQAANSPAAARSVQKGTSL